MNIKKFYIDYIIISYLLCFIFMFSCSSAPRGKTDNGFIYSIRNNNVVITKYTGKEKKIVIPQSINDLPVTEIGDDAFFKNVFSMGIESVVFPDTIIKIGRNAFSNNKITHLVLPPNIENIDSFAFSDNPVKIIEVKSKINTKKKLDLPNHFISFYISNNKNNGIYSFEPEDKNIPAYKANYYWYFDGNKLPPDNKKTFAILSVQPGIYINSINDENGENYWYTVQYSPFDTRLYCILPEGKNTIGLFYSTKYESSSGTRYIDVIVEAGQELSINIERIGITSKFQYVIK